LPERICTPAADTRLLASASTPRKTIVATHPKLFHRNDSDKNKNAVLAVL
jgi:hypothetical protein